ncbi:MAG: LA_2272 family surface repeat-containing protein [Myxococcota bacterium]
MVPLSLTVAGLAHAEAPPLEASDPNDSGASTPANDKHSECAAPQRRLVFGADFAPYVGTSSVESGRTAVRTLSLNLVGGYSGGLRGFEVGSVLNLEAGCVEGAQIAGVLNASEGSMRGFQVSGAVNLTRGSVRGVQVAGAANVTGPVSAALQVSGAANVVDGDVRGVQIAGATNVTTGWVRGLQLAGAANIATTSMSGAQIAGGMNFGAADFSGLQLAPVNFSSGQVSGAQIGVVNVAEKSDFSLGVVSVNTRGRTQVEGWTAVESGFFAAALKHGGKHWYGLYGLGTRAADPELNLVLGFGMDTPLSDRFYLGGDVVGYWEPRFKESSEHASLIQTRAYVGFRVLKPLSVYAGGSYNVFLASRHADNWAPDYAQRANTSGEPHVRYWPGAVVGLRLLSE